MRKDYPGAERREFTRIECSAPFDFKVCSKKTISKLLEGYTSNISKAGLLCDIKDKVRENDILWLAFDKGTLSLCSDLEKRSLIYQNGVVGKVVRVEPGKSGHYDVGIRFLTREEKNTSLYLPQENRLLR